MDCSTPSLPVPHHLPNFAQVHVHCIGDAIQPSHPLTPSSPSAVNLYKQQGLFQCVCCLHQMTIPELHLQHQSFQWVFRVNFLKIDWFDFLAVQGTRRSLLQHHSWKALILRCSVFFMFQLSQPYMTTGKTTELTIWTFVCRMSLLFNKMSRFVIAFLPGSNHLLSSWLHSPSAVILEPKKRKYVSISSFSPFICHEVMVLDAMILVFSIFSFQPAPSLSSFTLIMRLFSSSSLLPLEWYHLHIWDCW